MSILSPVTWVPWLPWLGVGYVSQDAFSTAFSRPTKILVGSVYLAIYLLASFWQGQVTKNVPEPYLDEIFHIPQAQAYCSGNFHVWDPKLTTPPGLYGLATLFGNLGGIRSCNVYTLRIFNTLVLIATVAYASDCRALITRAWKGKKKDERDESEPLSPSIMHTAFNIALFPPLFFFSGLFYTDVLSTCAVLRMYRLFLQRKGSLWLYVAGLLALTMRQTNIFWAAVFLGGLEVVRTIKSIEPVPFKEPSEPQTWKESTLFEFQRYSRGEIHDIPLKDAEVHDFALCAFSIAVAVLFHPIRIMQNLWPYIALLLSFAGFVYWNGGVVLGDKSNHVATIHLPQLLYLAAFIAFFSAPLLIPSIISFLRPFLSLLISSIRTHAELFPASKPTWKIILELTLLIISLFSTLAIIHFNTLIHPFTLADNRHYVFYAFRYTILFHPLIRYLLAPIYLLCISLTHTTLSGAPSSPSTPTPLANRTPPTRKSEVQQRLHDRTQAGALKIDDGPRTSFFLIWLLATALSLVTAPLVEPRYFIIPWVVWRLHVPGWSVASSPETKRGARRAGLGEVGVGKGGDYRLWIETAWFLAINGVTGYVFLFRGFEWAQEPGRVQRFMW